eukprot:10341573-Alexandrium_andersonii.AAC.1
MSASLVGSEMCIRDRMYLATQPAGRPLSPAGLVSTSNAAVPLGPSPAARSLRAACNAACPGTSPGGPMACVRRTT